MSELNGKKIVLGVCGGIAVYKTLQLISDLRKKGAEVHVIMTENATKFINPLMFREISANQVTVSMWSEVTQWNVTHIALASMADLFVIAPATANVIGKIANGIADDMLTTTVTATNSPVIIVPAMNTNMYENPIIMDNIDKLVKYNYIVMEPDAGTLACGVEGKGRFPETERIIFEMERALNEGLLLGKKVLVTAGGTREALDPVRFFSNRSSGKMGYAIAKAAARQGADVILISATEAIPDPAGITTVHVRSARDMKEALDAEFDDADVVVKAAAVADYHPANFSEQKIKKTADELNIKMVKNPDILYELGQRKKNQILIGFAAETENVLEYAKGKVEKKNADMIVANDVAAPGAGFNTETNVVTLVYPNREPENFELMSKDDVGKIIVKKVAELIAELQKSK